MATTSTMRFSSSYARIILASLAAASAIIKKNSLAANVVGSSALPQQQIDQAYLNPHVLAFLPADVAADASLIESTRENDRLRLQLLEQERTIAAAVDQLRDKAKTGKFDTKKSEKDLETQYHKVEDSLTSVNQTSENLNDIAGKLDALTGKHEKEWNQHRKEHTQQLIAALEKNGVSLSNLEKAQLMRQDAVAEIQRQYENEKLSSPVDFNAMSDKSSDYFRLQAYYAIHASLARQMEAGATNALEKTMDKLGEFFSAVDKDANKLSNAQEKEREQVLSEIGKTNKVHKQIADHSQLQQRDTKAITDSANLHLPIEQIKADAAELDFQEQQRSFKH
jgi:hypothetical protein